MNGEGYVEMEGMHLHSDLKTISAVSEGSPRNILDLVYHIHG